MKKLAIAVLVVLLALIAAGAVVIASGAYNVGADDEHSAFVFWVLDKARSRSIATRAASIAVPELNDANRIRRGAGNYAAMCEGCHMRPGVESSELSRGLYPRPPQLTQMTPEPAYSFWVIKHGIKASGMPAWGKSMSDDYIWDMVALLQKLPTMTPETYAAEVHASGGHAHGGEGMSEHEHSHEHSAEPADHDDEHHEGEQPHSHASGSH